jgi:hypothetical protein
MQIDFATSSFPGAIPQEGAGRLVNAMIEPMGDAQKFVRSPGVRRLYTTPPADGATGFRGMAFLNNTLWSAYVNKLYQSTSSAGGLLTRVPDASAIFLGSDPVFFAANMRATAGGPDIVAAQATGGAYVVTPAGVTVFPTDATHNLPVGQTVDVTYGLGFLFFGCADGRCFASDLNAITVPALNFTTANVKPDGLFRVIWFAQQLYLCGPDSIEVWGQPVNAANFPLNLVTAIPRGIVGPRAITGFENGIDLGLVFVSRNNQVMRLNGYQPERISTPDLERAISRTMDKSTIELTTFNVGGGHMLLKVRSGAFCWIFDFSTQTWHERQSWESSTSRLRQAVFAFGNTWMIGDDNSPDLGAISGTVYDEFNMPLTWQLDSKPVAAFPSRVTVGPAYFHFAPGTGNTVQSVVDIVNIAQGGAPPQPLILSTLELHNLAPGDVVYVTGVTGMQAVIPPGSGNPPTSQVNGKQFIVASPLTPVSFAVTDMNGFIPDSTAWSAYGSGGVARKQNTPQNAVAPAVQVSWSNDDGVSFVPPQILPLGPQGNSTQLVRTFLTGSFSPYGRIWRLVVSDPVYVSFMGAEMPRIGKRRAA